MTRLAVESDVAAENASRFQQPLGKRGPFPVSHSYTQHYDDGLFLVSTKTGQVRLTPSPPGAAGAGHPHTPISGRWIPHPPRAWGHVGMWA